HADLERRREIARCLLPAKRLPSVPNLDRRASGMPGLSGRGTIRLLECQYVRSSLFSNRTTRSPGGAQVPGLPLTRRIERGDSAAIERHLLTPMYRRDALRDESPDCIGNF